MSTIFYIVGSLIALTSIVVLLIVIYATFVFKTSKKFASLNRKITSIIWLAFSIAGVFAAYQISVYALPMMIGGLNVISCATRQASALLYGLLRVTIYSFFLFRLHCAYAGSVYEVNPSFILCFSIYAVISQLAVTGAYILANVGRGCNSSIFAFFGAGNDFIISLTIMSLFVSRLWQVIQTQMPSQVGKPSLSEQEKYSSIQGLDSKYSKETDVTQSSQSSSKENDVIQTSQSIISTLDKYDKQNITQFIAVMTKVTLLTVVGVSCTWFMIIINATIGFEHLGWTTLLDVSVVLMCMLLTMKDMQYYYIHCCCLCRICCESPIFEKLELTEQYKEEINSWIENYKKSRNMETVLNDLVTSTSNSSNTTPVTEESGNKYVDEFADIDTEDEIDNNNNLIKFVVINSNKNNQSQQGNTEDIDEVPNN